MMLFKLKELLKAAAFNLLRKRVDEKAIAWKDVYAEESDLTYFALSSNPIIAVNQEGKTSFFRECIEIQPKKNYLLKRIDYFFRFLNNSGFEKIGFKQTVPIKTGFSQSVVSSFKEYIETISNEKAFVENMLKADKNLRKIGYSIWENSKGISLSELRAAGLKNLSEEHFEIGLYFLWQMRSAAFLRRNSRLVRGEKHSFFNAVRAVSTEIVAEETGLSELVVKSEFCRLHVGNDVIYGLLSARAEGPRACDAEISPTISLQRDLSDLHLLDLICFQQDHGPDNYNIYSKNGELRVCAFDNDNPNAFFPFGGVELPLRGCCSLIGEKVRLRRSFFSYETAEKIMKTDEEKLSRLLTPYLNFVQRLFLKKRIMKIKKAIENSGEKTRFIKTGEWSEDCLKEELSGAFGTTYLTKVFIKK